MWYFSTHIYTWSNFHSLVVVNTVINRHGSTYLFQFFCSRIADHVSDLLTSSLYQLTFLPAGEAICASTVSSNIEKLLYMWRVICISYFENFCVALLFISNIYYLGILFWERVSLCSPGSPQTRDSSVSAPQILGEDHHARLLSVVCFKSWWGSYSGLFDSFYILG